jgi:hypothetical protein
MDGADENGDSVLDFSELASSLCDGELACAEVLMVLMDNDGSWDLTHEEVSHALRALGRIACDVCAPEAQDLLHGAAWALVEHANGHAGNGEATVG